MDWSEKRIEPRFNIAPSQEIVTIIQLPLDSPTVQMATWGLRPYWLVKGKPPPINARAESLKSNPMFREAYRCLVPATGFYEWRNGQPMHIRLRDGEMFAFAGLWLPPQHSGGAPTAAIVTTRPNELVATIHIRMPAILRRDDELMWLDPTQTMEQAQKLLAPVDAHALEAYPVSPLVNSWENEGAALVEPVATIKEDQISLPF
jgi:putative SOS response-associated peptidase YedK